MITNTNLPILNVNLILDQSQNNILLANIPKLTNTLIMNTVNHVEHTFQEFIFLYFI